MSLLDWLFLNTGVSLALVIWVAVFAWTAKRLYRPRPPVPDPWERRRLEAAARFETMARKRRTD